MATPRTDEKRPRKGKKEVELGVQLFTLAYDPRTTAVSFQTDIPISKVMELVQLIQLGQQRELARREVLAEIAAKKKKEPKEVKTD